MMKRFLFVSAMALLLVGCNRELEPAALGRLDNKFSVECAPYEITDENGIPTRSVIGNEDDGQQGAQKVTNWNIWVYDHSTGSIVNDGGKNIYGETMQTFFTETSGIDGDLIFPDMDGHYDVYIFANVEKLQAPATSSAANSYAYTFDNYNAFKIKGFPMANVYTNFCPASAVSHTFTVLRLVSRYDVVIVNNIPNSEFTLTSVKLMNAAKKVRPFQANSKVDSDSEVDENFDYFDVDELEQQSDGSYYGVLYMLENNHGQVFKSGVEDDIDRKPENMINPGNGRLCTYLQFVGDIDLKEGYGNTGCTFNHYFGSGRNAGVLRNINTEVYLTLSGCPSPDNPDWRIVPGEPYDTRAIEFNPDPVNIHGDGQWTDIVVTPKSGDPQIPNSEVHYTLKCPNASSAGLTFSGVSLNTEVQGPQVVKVKSSYSGTKTVKLIAQVDDRSYDVDINVTAPQIEPNFYLSLTGYDDSHADQGGGYVIFDYELRADDGLHWLDADRGEYMANIIDWGYNVNASGERVPYAFDQNHYYMSRRTTEQGHCQFRVTLYIVNDNYQRMGNTSNLYVKAFLEDGREYYVEYRNVKEPDPDPQPVPQPTLLNGLYYTTDNLTYRILDACGTYSSQHGINTAGNFDGECYYYKHLIIDEHEPMNGAIYPREQYDEKARFVYFVDSVPQSVTVSEVSVTRIVNDMYLATRYNSEYPYTDGKVYMGEHYSYATLSVTLPDGSKKRVWGYIWECDYFGDMCKYYPHYR